MNEAPRALVVDDEAAIRRYLRETLRRAGYMVVGAANGDEALEVIREDRFDVAVVDLNLGGRTDGQSLLEAIRWRWPATAVVILTAYGSLESAIAAIREGVDGYLLKPAKPEEIREAVQQALDRRRRLRSQVESAETARLECGPFDVDLYAHVATRDHEPLDLTPQEFRLLSCLIQNSPRVVSPLALVRAIRDAEVEDNREAGRIIKWYIHRLRRQVEPDPTHPCHIITVRGVGYRFQG